MADHLKLLKTLHEHGFLEHEGLDGHMDCSYCGASGWGFIEHKDDCPVLEVRTLLGCCRHGFTGGYNHGGGSCPALTTDVDVIT